MTNNSSENLPTLTPATIQRAKEGLAAACDHTVNQSIQQAVKEISLIAEGEAIPHASGSLRALVMRSLIHSLFRVKVEYPERIPQSAAILAPNHLNHIDPFLLLSEVPNIPYYYILGDARTLYNQWWKRRVLSLGGGVIPLLRRWGEEFAVIEGAKTQETLVQLAKEIEENVPTGGDIQTLRQIDRSVQAILACGDGIILFPEGRLGTREGKLQLPLKKGVALYALRSGIPIVPVAIIGTKDLYLWKTLTLRFGHPLVFPQVKHPKRKEIDEVLEKLQQALLELLPKNYQESDGVKLLNDVLNRMFY